MRPGRDPIERAARRERDLHGVSTWEPRTRVDRILSGVHGGVRPALRGVIVLAGMAVLVLLFAGGLFQAVTEPVVGVLIVLSAVPALLLAAYVWYADVTTGEPLTLLAATFTLGVLFAPFAGIISGAIEGTVPGLAGPETAGPAAVLFFVLVVGPVEESVKLAAAWLYAFRDTRFDAVISGAVYGAAAGLGFATIENALYISGELGGGLEPVASTAVERAMAGPGHVIYSGIAGFYLGLAKFNREHAGPLVLKGLLIAALLHGGYNTLVVFVPGVAAELLSVPVGAAAVGFIVVFDAAAGYFLYRKIRRYRNAYRAVEAREIDPDAAPELVEFDAPSRPPERR